MTHQYTRPKNALHVMQYNRHLTLRHVERVGIQMPSLHKGRYQSTINVLMHKHTTTGPKEWRVTLGTADRASLSLIMASRVLYLIRHSRIKGICSEP